MLQRGPAPPAAAQTAGDGLTLPCRRHPPARRASAAALSSTARSVGSSQRRSGGGRFLTSTRAEVGSDPSGLVPAPQTRHFTRKALRRIEREGPREADLRDEVGRIVKECLPRASTRARRSAPAEPDSRCSRPGPQNARLARTAAPQGERLHGLPARRSGGGSGAVERSRPLRLLAAAAHPPALRGQACAGDAEGRLARLGGAAHPRGGGASQLCRRTRRS